MTYNCLIVDDERPALKLLDAYIQKLPHLDLVASCENGVEAIAALQQYPVDLLFLDIQMPDLTGLELLQTLTIKPQVILTTAYRDYAVEGFAMDVTDYLVKPFSFERFIQAVNKATEILKLKNQGETTAAMPANTALSNLSTQLPDGYVFLRTTYKMEKVALQDILYVESMREYVGVYTPEKRYVIHQSMNSMAEKLSPPHFMRIHRSYIINMHHIDAIKGNTVQIQGKEISIGGNYRKGFFEQIESY